MNKASKFFYQKSSFIVAILLTAVTFSYLLLFMVDMAKGHEVAGNDLSLALSFGITPDMVQEFFSIRSKEMLASFVEFNTIWDNIFPLLYGLMYVFWLSYLFKPFESRVRWLNVFPFLQTIFDWLENFTLVRIANGFIENTPLNSTDVTLLSTFSLAKWTVSTLIFVAIFLGIGWRIYRKLKK